MLDTRPISFYKHRSTGTVYLDLGNRAAPPGSGISEKVIWDESMYSCGFGSRLGGLVGKINSLLNMGQSGQIKSLDGGLPE